MSWSRFSENMTKKYDNIKKLHQKQFIQQGGAKTFAGSKNKPDARANEVYFSARHKFSKRACSKTPTSKIWSFDLIILESCTRKTVFIFTLKNQLFPCIRLLELCFPQRQVHFLCAEKGKSWIPKYHRRSFSTFELFRFEKKKFHGSENLLFCVIPH